MTNATKAQPAGTLARIKELLGIDPAISSTTKAKP